MAGGAVGLVGMTLGTVVVCRSHMGIMPGLTELDVDGCAGSVMAAGAGVVRRWYRRVARSVTGRAVRLR